ncbi:MAG: hypothetical protein IPJ50_19735 [Betaproteobacteria bacterium]|nr:hypothetical protein [Betaproteobacteria bacterium]
MLLGAGGLAMCTGCASIGNEFTVDTSLPDPVIYGPGTHPDKPLRIPLEGFAMKCERATVALSSTDGLNTLEFPITIQLWATSSGLRNTPVAHVPPDVALSLIRRSRSGLHDELAKALAPPGFCGFSWPAKNAPELAARVLQLALPRPYSVVLQSAYNHRVWKAAPAAESRGAVSLDLLPGMRLRVDNSLPISPAGANSKDEYPSSFAAPAFLQFHSLTGRELCDPPRAAGIPNKDYLCDMREEMWEPKNFLSAAGGLARLGLQQTKDPQTATHNDNEHEASGIIDLLERTHLSAGAWRYWRLVLPVDRPTDVTKQLGPITPGGSPENRRSAPLLIAAESLNDLNALDYGAAMPCAAAPNTVRCHSLRYRAVPTPEFLLRVNGQGRWVPIGTTLADVLSTELEDGFAPRAYFLSGAKGQNDAADPYPFTAAVARRVLEGVTVRRTLEGKRLAVVPTSMHSDEAARRFLRLQLVPGDEIIWP